MVFSSVIALGIIGTGLLCGERGLRLEGWAAARPPRGPRLPRDHHRFLGWAATAVMGVAVSGLFVTSLGGS
jgi:hypothetical protein